MSRFALRLTAFLAALACALPFAHLRAATELQLKNGDTLRGEHLKTENGLIHFKTPVLGTLLVPTTDATVAEIPDIPPESLVGLPPRKASDTAQRPKSETETASAAPKQSPDVAKTDTTPPAPAVAKNAPPAPKPKWKGKIEFGYQQQSGRRDIVTGSFRFDAETAAKAPDLFKVSSRVLYGKQNKVTNNERYEGSFRWRHEFGERLFSQSLTSYYADRVKRIDHNAEQNVGLGYQFIRHARHTLNAGLGGTGQYREALGTPEDVIYLSEFFQDYTYKINGRLSFVQDSSALYSTKEVFHNKQPADNYRLRFNAALQGRVTERVSLNLRYEYEYDNTIANPDLRGDQRITSSIGYAL